MVLRVKLFGGVRFYGGFLVLEVFSRGSFLLNRGFKSLYLKYLLGF